MLDEDLLRVRQLVALGTGWKRRWFRMPNSLRPRILLEEKGRRRKWRKGGALRWGMVKVHGKGEITEIKGE